MTVAVHYMSCQRFTPAVGEPYDTYIVACRNPSENISVALGNLTAVKEQVTCKRCQRSPLFDALLYRGRY